MDIALCYESVLPARGGCETYITGLARRLAADGHAVHLYATRWDAAALPAALCYHPVRVAACPRFLRPWFFASACQKRCPVRSMKTSSSVGLPSVTASISPGKASTSRATH